MLSIWMIGGGQTVSAAIGSRNRTASAISDYKLSNFTVHNQGVYRKLTQDIPKLPGYPPKPPQKSAVEINVQWRTNCANFICDYLTQKDMLLTFLFHRWDESPR